MVGNECEIIESFVRYNANFFDQMYFIYDVGCVDGSIDILRKLQKEGFPLVLCDEALVSYEQRAIENKYMRIISGNGADLIIPLDADEFLTALAKHDLKRELNSLDLDCAYLIGWKNYVVLPEDDLEELFIPRRITNCEVGMSSFTKVIVPARLINEYGVTLATGHHDIKSKKAVNIVNIHNIYIAHYPIISIDQYKSKIYCNCIRYITWLNRGNNEGIHLNKSLAELEDGIDNIDNTVNLYDKNTDVEIEYAPLDTDCCSKPLDIVYKDEAKVDFISNIIKTGQVMALKAYNLEIEKRERNGIPRILVYGTGNDALHLLDGAPEDLVNIRAYLNSNSEKKFTMYNRRIVVTPDMARCFPYDKIVISSAKYYDEMYNALIENGISKEKIEGTEYILDLMINKI
jgi:hypothetical protein